MEKGNNTTEFAELVEPGALLTTGQQLRVEGWARHPLLEANFQSGFGSLGNFRFKFWDYYGIWAPKLYFGLTLAQLGYADLIGLYVIDLENYEVVEQNRVFLPGSALQLPHDCNKSRIVFEKAPLDVLVEVDGKKRRVCVSHGGFEKQKGLYVDVELHSGENDESIVCAQNLGKKGFYYNQKQNAIPASGSIVWRDQVYNLRPPESMGQFDWGRGRWPYRSHWIWGSANGLMSDGRRLAFNLGRIGEADGENAFFVDGRLHKLLGLEVALKEHDPGQGWRFRDQEGRLELEFVPQVERVARTRLLLVDSEVRQFFGHYEGHVISEEGEHFAVESLLGFAEEHRARW